MCQKVFLVVVMFLHVDRVKLRIDNVKVGEEETERYPYLSLNCC